MMNLAATGTGDPFGKSAIDATGWLGLAAAPTFVSMAWAVALDSPGVCPAFTSWPSVNGMALMYLLMGLFHLSPWLRLLSHRAQRRIDPTEGD